MNKMSEKYSSTTRHKLTYIFWFLYLGSGFAGLVYQVVWVRLFGLKFGVSSLAIGSVLAAFMLGLAWGSKFFGRFADKCKSPLKLYAAIELGVGLYALIFPFLLEAADKFYLSFFMGRQGGFAGIALGRLLLALILLFFPTALMGGTLPVLARFFVRKAEFVGREIGYLYGLNILGAMLGCFSAGFFLIEFLGVSGTNSAAVGLNLLIALVAFLLAGTVEEEEVPATVKFSFPLNSSPQASLPQPWLYVILFVVVGAGFTSLSYELLWHRILSLMLRNTVYAFSTMLTTFLGGLFLGSLLVGRLISKKTKGLPKILGLLEMGIGLYALAVIPLFGRLNEFFYVLEIEKGFFGQSWALFSMGQFLLCAGVMLLPAIMMGAVFPLACELYFRLPSKGAGQGTGQGVGRVYALNTLGAVLGSLASGFLLVPLLGTQGSVFLAAGVNIILGAWVIFLATREKSLETGWIALSVLFLLLAGWGMTRDITFRKSIELAGEEILFSREDNSSLIEVTRDRDSGVRMLISNRQQQEGDSSWLSVYNQRKQVYLPLFLHKNPKKVLGIGLGTGISFAGLTNYPLELAECVELSPGVIQAVEFFAAENKDIVNNPRVKIIEADGRNYLRLTENKYDLIIADLFSSYRAGVGNLYSREHYLQCKDRLAPGGIMCQWLPPHQLPGDSLKLIIKTFQSVFPHSSLWLTRQAMVLIAAPEPLRIDYKRFKAYFDAGGELGQDLRLVGLDNPITFLNSFLMGERKLAAFAGDLPVNTDDMPLIEFMTPKEFYRLTDRSLFDQHVAETLPYREPVYAYLANVDEDDLSIRLEDNYKARKYSDKGEDSAAMGDYMAALSDFRRALEIDPSQAGAKRAMAKYYLSQGRDLSEGGLFNEAVRSYRKVLEMVPMSPKAHLGLGIIYFQQGDIFRARQELKAAFKLDPYDKEVKKYLEKIP